MMTDTNHKKGVLKNLIRKLHEGANPEEVKREFKETVADITPVEIAQIEGELVNEGMPLDEIHKLCDIHLAMFRESLEKETIPVPAGHPIYILMEEHKAILRFADDLAKSSKTGKTKLSSDDLKNLSLIAKHFKESENHYLREENVLFPYMEKHGITQPPAIMWAEHDKIRQIEKELHILMDKPTSQDFMGQLNRVASSLADTLSSHFYKENNVLFPTSLKVIGEEEWPDIRRQFDQIGYCPFTPQSATVSFKVMETLPSRSEGGENLISFENGALSKEEIEAIFDSLPVEVTFVDKDDKLRYFSQSKEMIFVRTKAAIGLKVQQCHPQKSIHVVNKILEDFRNGRRNVAEFWINFKDKLVHIRYFPVRNKNGDYLGCVEVTQDISNIKQIKGEKRLLDTE